MNALQAAQLCASSYDVNTSDLFTHWFNIAGVAGGVNYIGSDTVLVMRGSDDIEDWLRDLSVWPEQTPDGIVDAGFNEGLDEFLNAVTPAMKGKLILAGHSLGAARCCLIAAKIHADRMFLFGCPNVGFSDLRDRVKKSQVIIENYRNGFDPVPLVPPLYEQIVEPVQLKPAHTFDDPIQYHMIDEYVATLNLQKTSPG